MVQTPQPCLYHAVRILFGGSLCTQRRGIHGGLFEVGAVAGAMAVGWIHGGSARPCVVINSSSRRVPAMGAVEYGDLRLWIGIDL